MMLETRHRLLRALGEICLAGSSVVKSAKKEPGLVAYLKQEKHDAPSPFRFDWGEIDFSGSW